MIMRVIDCEESTPVTQRSKRRARPRSSSRNEESAESKEAPLQVMVPLPVKRQLAIMSAERGESLRTLMLRGLRAIGLDISDHELVDRRKQSRRTEGTEHGAK
jgi:hypothetical protein